MQAEVTEQGVVVPKGWLQGVDKVKILREGDRIVLIPITQNDPVWDFGSNPVTTDVSDASENHDKYITGAE